MRRRIWLATALAVGTACLVLAQALAAQGQKREDGFPYGDLTEVRLEGQLISLGEAMAGKYGAKIAGGEARKQIGFATPEGEVFSLLDTEGYRKLIAGTPVGQGVRIQARRFPRSHLLEILASESVPEERLRRKFFCDICAIHTDQWGPCVCCGQEMKVVRDAP